MTVGPSWRGGKGTGERRWEKTGCPESTGQRGEGRAAAVSGSSCGCRRRGRDRSYGGRTGRPQRSGRRVCHDKPEKPAGFGRHLGGACVSEADRASRSEGGWGRCGPGERAGFRQVPIEDARVTVPEDTTGGPTHGGGSGAVEQTRGVACPGLMARALGRPRALASHLQPGDSIRDPGEEWGEAASRYFGIWTGSPWAFGWRPKKVTQPASFNTGLAFLHHFHPLSQLSGQTLQAGDQVALPSCHGAGLVSA